MIEPIWIEFEEVRLIHQMQLAEHGGATGIRDKGLLESALDKPRDVFVYSEPPASVFQIAASYAYGLARNHPFVDGNKRTAFVVCLSFLQQNGFKLTASLEARYLTFYSLAAGDISEKDLSDWLEASSEPL